MKVLNDDEKFVEYAFLVVDIMKFNGAIAKFDEYEMKHMVECYKAEIKPFTCASHICHTRDEMAVRPAFRMPLDSYKA
jgi:hypothetical protein